MKIKHALSLLTALVFASVLHSATATVNTTIARTGGTNPVVGAALWRFYYTATAPVDANGDGFADTLANRQVAFTVNSPSLTSTTNSFTIASPVAGGRYWISALAESSTGVQSNYLNAVPFDIPLKADGTLTITVTVTVAISSDGLGGFNVAVASPTTSTSLNP